MCAVLPSCTEDNICNETEWKKINQLFQSYDSQMVSVRSEGKYSLFQGARLVCTVAERPGMGLVVLVLES